MKVLRSNKDSVMAMLEAFVYDPLINWRLLNTTDAGGGGGDGLGREGDHKDAGMPPRPIAMGMCMAGTCNMD